MGTVEAYFDGAELLVLRIDGELESFRLSAERWAATGQSVGGGVLVETNDDVVLAITPTDQSTEHMANDELHEVVAQRRGEHSTFRPLLFGRSKERG